MPVFATGLQRYTIRKELNLLQVAIMPNTIIKLQHHLNICDINSCVKSY